MVIDCNVQCRSVSLEMLEDLNLQEDTGGIWLPCMIDMAEVECVKMTTNDSTDPMFQLTSLYMKTGDSYIIDIPYHYMKEAFINYHDKKVIKYKPKDINL